MSRVGFAARGIVTREGQDTRWWLGALERLEPGQEGAPKSTSIGAGFNLRGASQRVLYSIGAPNCRLTLTSPSLV